MASCRVVENAQQNAMYSWVPLYLKCLMQIVLEISDSTSESKFIAFKLELIMINL